MKKIKKIIFGIFLGFILVFVACTTMSKSDNISLSYADYYELCNFDFIIPNPWYTQIPEIKAKDFISNVVPYYVTKIKMTGNNKIGEINLFMIEEKYDLNITPYSKDLLLEGMTLSENTIVIDEKTKKNLDINIGDEISFLIGNTTFKFNISGVSYDNKFSNYPSAVIHYEDQVKIEIEKMIKNLTYSGAYVKTTNVIPAENYFLKDYRAMGKVGIPSWYENNESYNFMKESIENQNVAKEIINVYQLRVAENSNIAEKKKSNSRQILLVSIIIFIINFFIWLLYIVFSSKNYRERIKSGTKQTSVVFEFVLGDIFTLVTFFVGLSFINKSENIISISPLILSLFLSFVLVVLFANKIIYRKKKRV